MSKLITTENPIYPERLKIFLQDFKDIHADGNLDLMNTRTVAVVGSRRCSAYGKSVARAIGRECAERGITLVSGLASGIDSEGHRGCLERGGNTIAVLGNGCDRYYPAWNRNLQDEIREKGLLISEYDDSFEPRAYTFPVRNRIISALSDAVVIVEAGSRSGSLITAECAAEQGKEVFAVPGNINSGFSFGTNKLIKDMVNPLISIEGFFNEIGAYKESEDRFNGLGKEEIRVMKVVEKYGEVEIERIHQETDIKPSIINGIITVLEMKGLIFCEIGKVCVAKFR